MEEGYFYGRSRVGVGGWLHGIKGVKVGRWEGGKRLGSCKRKMVNIVHVGNSCGTQVGVPHTSFTHTFMYYVCMSYMYMNMNGIINIHECMCVHIHYMTYIHTLRCVVKWHLLYFKT